MNKQLSLMTLIAIASQTCAPAYAERWDKDNDPALFGSGYNYTFSPDPTSNPSALPLKGMLPPEKMTWSDSYWPRKRGSINYNWNSPTPNGFKLDLSYARNKTREELAKLSPAQKLDLALGDYNYDYAKSILKGSDSKAEDFEGLCDGWTIASLQFEEPKPIDYVNPDGLVIPFGSSDLKALIAYDISQNHEDEEFENVFVGTYCIGKFGQKTKSAGCTDLNPGAFHVVLANEIGIRKQGFAVDIQPNKETWNQPAYGFEFKVVGSAKSEKAPKAYLIHAKLMINEDDPFDHAKMDPRMFSWNPTTGTSNFFTETIELDYILELDYSDRIIGGSWDNDSYYTHPDLFWKTTNQIPFSEDFKFLEKLVKRRSSK